MKSLSYLLSIYIIVLLGMTCSAGDNCTGNACARIYAASQHHDSSEESDHCSPFCICSCCSSTGFTLPSKHTSPMVSLTYDKVLRLDYIFSFHPGYANTIWQPPKLS